MNKLDIKALAFWSTCLSTC